jgi:hypothetical protein
MRPSQPEPTACSSGPAIDCSSSWNITPFPSTFQPSSAHHPPTNHPNKVPTPHYLVQSPSHPQSRLRRKRQGSLRSRALLAHDLEELLAALDSRSHTDGHRLPSPPPKSGHMLQVSQRASTGGWAERRHWAGKLWEVRHSVQASFDARVMRSAESSLCRTICFRCWLILVPSTSEHAPYHRPEANRPSTIPTPRCLARCLDCRSRDVVLPLTPLCRFCAQARSDAIVVFPRICSRVAQQHGGKERSRRWRTIGRGGGRGLDCETRSWCC